MVPNLAPLTQLQKRLQQLAGSGPTASGPYRIPGRWVHLSNRPESITVNPYQFWLNRVNQILAQPAVPVVTDRASGGSWSQQAVIYNLFVRNSTAFDHDGDGELSLMNQFGFVETGTFMKSIALLPYIRGLGCNTIHLLPITAVGQDGNKGSAGSPYAIRNPYRLDERLAEPAVALGVELEFGAFVAAAHHLGMRVVMEFVFRTGSKDSDWVMEHPEWFYWIDAAIPDRASDVGAVEIDDSQYGMPVFSPEACQQIKADVEAERFDRLIPPPPIHQQMFLPPPAVSDLYMEDGSWRARYGNGRIGRIPGAFADWPIDDAQPPWGDVTYLRLYDHPDYNYIAYNSVRMYSQELAQPENRIRPLWERIIQIIPHYQQQFGIDGAMIDMGHALPMGLKQEMVAAARGINPDFAFWDENFKISGRSREEGYNGVMGDLPFMLHNPEQLRLFLQKYVANGMPINFFGAPENHNTPRAAVRPGGLQFSRLAAALVAMLPDMPFLHSGVEFGETVPVNTGLDFTPAEIARYPSAGLPLFSFAAYDWEGDDTELTGWWQRSLALRHQFAPAILNLGRETVELSICDENPQLWALIRHTADWSLKIALVVNGDMTAAQSGRVWLPTGREMVMDHYTAVLYPTDGNNLPVTLPPGGCLWLVL